MIEVELFRYCIGSDFPVRSVRSVVRRGSRLSIYAPVSIPNDTKSQIITSLSTLSNGQINLLGRVGTERKRLDPVGVGKVAAKPTDDGLADNQE